jgi:alcohol dehydrogenase
VRTNDERHASWFLTAMIRRDLLSFDPFSGHPFPLEQANQAGQHAQNHGEAFHLTVLQPMRGEKAKDQPHH